jgi:hypothetical protein
MAIQALTALHVTPPAAIQVWIRTALPATLTIIITQQILTISRWVSPQPVRHAILCCLIGSRQFIPNMTASIFQFIQEITKVHGTLALIAIQILIIMPRLIV